MISRLFHLNIRTRAEDGILKNSIGEHPFKMSTSVCGHIYKTKYCGKSSNKNSICIYIMLRSILGGWARETTQNMFEQFPLVKRNNSTTCLSSFPCSSIPPYNGEVGLWLKTKILHLFGADLWKKKKENCAAYSYCINIWINKHSISYADGQDVARSWSLASDDCPNVNNAS